MEIPLNPHIVDISILSYGKSHVNPMEIPLNPHIVDISILS